MKAYNWKRQNEVKPKEFDFLLPGAIRVIDETKAPWTAKHMGRPLYEAKPLVFIQDIAVDATVFSIRQFYKP